MEGFLSEDALETATKVPINKIKEESQSEAADSTELYVDCVKIETSETELMSHFIVDVEVSRLTEKTFKNEPMTHNEGFCEDEANHIVTSHNGQMDVSIIKESCSSPTMDAFVVAHEKLYECRICQKLFKDATTLSIHTLIHDKDKSTVKNKINNSYQDQETIICKICGVQFTSLLTYLKHRQTHLFEKPYNCEICMKNFNSKFLLTNHERIHTGEKPFSCDLCNKTFAEKVNLNRHKRSHTGSKPYNCNVCLKRFSSKQNLEAHVMSLHTNVNLWPFQCKICKKRWPNKGDFKRHLKMHSGEMRFSCDICGKSYSRKYRLIYHIQSHNNERHFACKICNKRFLSRCDRKKHFNVHMTKH